MKVIGLTGGIGGGKSAVAAILRERYGAYVIDTDTLGHEVMEPGTPVYRAILEEFGDRLAVADSEAPGRAAAPIDRKRLAEIIFSDEAARQRVNALIHPAVACEMECRISRCLEDGTRYVVFETALLIEAGLERCCDEVWYVRVPEEVRRERLKQSRGYPDAKASAIFASQKSDAEFMAVADAVIENTGNLADTAAQIAAILEREETGHGKISGTHGVRP